MTSSPDAARDPGLLDPPSAVHRAGEVSVLAEYPDTRAVLAAAAALRALAPPHLVDLVPAERTLLLVGAAPRDRHELAELLGALPAAPEEHAPGTEHTLAVVYDGADLAEVAELLSLSTDALITAHTEALWTVAFGGFSPGFPYLVADEPGADGPGADGPPWDVPRRGEPRTSVPAGAVGLASRYCGIYPRPSPGGWQLIGRTDAELFDAHRTPPALLAPGSRVRFVARRASARLAARAPAPSGTSVTPARPTPPTTHTTPAIPAAVRTSALARARSGAAAVPDRLGRRRGAGAVPLPVGRPALEVLSSGPLLLVQDSGRPGHGAIGVSPSGAFDRDALVRAGAAVGNPTHSPALEALLGPMRLRALAPTVISVAGGAGRVTVRRADPEGPELELDAGRELDQAIALDPGDVLTLDAPTQGLRRVVAVRGGIRGVRRAADTTADRTADRTADSASREAAPARRAEAAAHGVSASDLPFLGSLSRDTLSGLGPAPLGVGDVLLVGPEQGLDAVPAPSPQREENGPADGDGDGDADAPPGIRRLEIPMLAGPRDDLLGRAALEALISVDWTVRSDSDRVGVRLDGPPLPVPEGSGSLPSEAMVPGAIQVPPSGLPVVFGPDHPTTGGYPVIAVVTRTGLDRLAQVAPGAVVRFLASAGSARGSGGSPRGSDGYPS